MGNKVRLNLTSMKTTFQITMMRYHDSMSKLMTHRHINLAGSQQNHERKKKSNKIRTEKHETMFPSDMISRNK